MEQNYKFYYEKKDLKLSFEGSREFVEKLINDFLDQIRNEADNYEDVHVNEDEKVLESSETKRISSISRFFEEKKPANTYEAIACVLSYNLASNQLAELDQDQIRKSLVIVKFRPPSNMSQALSDCKRRTGFIDQGSQRGFWKLASEGESLVEIDLPRTK